MLRTELKIPILAVSLELYNDDTNTRNATVKRVQWYSEGGSAAADAVRGKRVLIMDEVDDTRTTLKFCVDEVMRTSKPAAVAVAVVHNKLKPKEAAIPRPGSTSLTLSSGRCSSAAAPAADACMSGCDLQVVYMAAEDVPNLWNCYPWDAAAYGHTIEEHEALARQCLQGAN
eukprot:23525_5